MSKTKLTVRTVKDLQPSDRDVVVWDSDNKGFGCKVTPAGRKTFFFYYRTASGQQRRPTIGEFGSIQPEAARVIARTWAAEVAQGGDPSKTRAHSRTMPTVSNLAQRYLEEHAELRKAQSSLVNDRRLLAKRILPALGSKKIDTVTRADIEGLHRQLRTTPFEANRTVALISKMFSLAEGWSLIAPATNPAKGVKLYKESRRERYLSGEELKKLWAALEDAEVKGTASASAIRAIRLLILTGRRVSEVLAMRWSDIDFERRVIHFPKTKTGALTAPLSDFTEEYLRRLQPLADSPFVCPGRNRERPLVNIQKPWRMIRNRAGLDDVRLHDLRHSYASLAAGLGMSLPMIGRLLGHTQAATTERYAHLAQDPVRQAANSIEEELLRRIGPR